MSSIAETLASMIGADRVASDADALNARRYDQWAVKHLRDWRGEAVPAPGCVVRPQSVEDVQKVVKLAAEKRVPLIPYGLGSGVCGGIEPTPNAILLDMSGMKRVRYIDSDDLLASFDAGLNGMEAEEAVAAHGLTIGHWPQSIAISSVGGWVATRASGQFSTAYGNIEDIIHSIEAVLPNGELVTLGKAVRAAAGPDLRHLLMGAEGTMGVITGVTFSLRAKAPHRDYSIFYANDMRAGFEAQRQIVRADWRPPVMRQYDGREVRRLFRDYERDGKAMLLMVHEGPKARVDAELAAMHAICASAGLTGWPQVPSAKLPAAIALSGRNPDDLQWGTLDSWLTFKLSGAHVPDALPVAGGLSASDTLLQLQADALQRPVRRHAVREASAYGAALAAGMGAGLFGTSDLKRLARYDAEFLPKVGRDEADAAFARWCDMVMV